MDGHAFQLGPWLGGRILCCCWFLAHAEKLSTEDLASFRGAVDTSAAKLWPAEDQDGRLTLIKTLPVSQCVRSISVQGRRFWSGIGSPARWRTFAGHLHRHLKTPQGLRSWRRLRGLALQHQICLKRVHTYKDCMINSECCALGLVAAHITLLLASPAGYSLDMRLLHPNTRVHRVERLGSGMGYVLWNPVGFTLMDFLYSGWPLFALLRELRSSMWRVWDESLLSKAQRHGMHIAREYSSRLKMLWWETTRSIKTIGRARTQLSSPTWICDLLKTAKSGPPEDCPLQKADQALLAAQEALRHWIKFQRSRTHSRRNQMKLEDAVNVAQRSMQEFLVWIQGPSDNLSPAARIAALFCIAGDAIFSRLEVLQEGLDRIFLLSAPRRPARTEQEYVDIDDHRICPAAADLPEQGSLVAEASYLNDFYIALSGIGAAAAHQQRNHAWGEEAWVVFLWGGESLKAKQSIAIHTEVVRTLAHSVRVSEAPQRRPFVVLAVGSLPNDAVQELSQDGLIVRHLRDNETLPMYEPMLFKQNLPAGVLKKNSAVGSWFSDRGLAPTFAQLGAWALTEFRRVVVLDTDMLVMQRCDELFDLGSVPFAAAHENHRDRDDPRPDRKGKRTLLLNAAVMSLRPNAAFIQRLREDVKRPVIKLTGERFGTAVSPTFQSVIDAFFLDRSIRRGFAVWDDRGHFAGCHKFAEPGIKSDIIIPAGEVQSAHCLLSMDYNFFVDFPHAFHAAYSFRKAAPWDVRASPGAPRRTVLNGTSDWLQRTGQLRSAPKIIHFPGVTRKPWQRWAKLSRSPWDEEWWRVHTEMCSRSSAPCRLSCERAFDTK